MTSLAVAIRLSLRELRSGLAGFRIFFCSLALGVGAIAAVGTLSQGLLSGIAENGRAILGGDAELVLVHRPFSAAESAFAAAQGRTSQIISMRAMAYSLARGARAPRELIELKAVDSAYPLYGSVGMSPAIPLGAALACGDSVCGAVAEQALLDRLHLTRGAFIRIGRQRFRLASVLTNEPDRLSGGFSLGPHVLVSTAALARTGLVTIGSLIDYSVRVRLRPGRSPAAFRNEANARFPAAGWQIRDRDHAAPGTEKFIGEFADFLTLVGLTALAIAGVGAGQAVHAFLDRKRDDIATLKSLGATGRFVFLLYFLQVIAIAALASVAGAAAGAMVPFLAGNMFDPQLSVPTRLGIFAGPLAFSFSVGLLSAAVFAIPPLARARDIVPARLFRDRIAPERARGRFFYVAAACVLALLLISLVLATSHSFSLTGWFVACAAGAMVTLFLLADGVQFLVRCLPLPSWPTPRFALAGLTRPGSPTRAIITTLGLGLSLLATVTILHRTISAQVNGTLIGSAPSFYFIDIQPADALAFDRTIARFATARDYRRTPMIRGRIEALNGVPAARARVTSGTRWALNGDRGITYSAKEPTGAQLVAGRWWPSSYRGPTLISFDSELARGMGLKIGDTLTLNVLGRDIEGRIANLRHIDFSTGRQNFVLVLSPGVIDKAPHSFLATVRVPRRDEAAMYRAVTDRFPSVSTVRVRDVVAELDSLLDKLALGVRAASIITIAAGLLVLAGALAAGLRMRIYEAAVMKVLGATRGQIARVHALEYALLGLLMGVLAVAAGAAAASLVSHRVFKIAPVIDWTALLLSVCGGAAVVIASGLVFSWVVLSARPARLLRTL